MNQLIEKYQEAGWTFTTVYVPLQYNQIYFKSPRMLKRALFENFDEEELLNAERTAFLQQVYLFEVRKKFDKVENNLLNQLATLDKSGHELPKELTINEIIVKFNK